MPAGRRGYCNRAPAFKTLLWATWFHAGWRSDPPETIIIKVSKTGASK